MSNEVRRYRVLETLGKGGFGTVYRAELLGTGGFAKQVALKVLNDEGQREIALRLRDEARILGLLHHRAVVGVDNLVRLEPGWAVVMEYVAGVDATAVIRYGPAPVRVVLEIVEEIASALHAAYTLPSEVTGRPLYLIHRDIKPSNIRLTSRGEVKILDFGVALASFGTREARTRATLFGSFQYMAPERLDGIEGPKGDIYSLGLVMARLLSSARFPEPPKHPRRHSTFVELVTSRVREALADVPDQVDAEALQAIVGLVSAMISFEPAERPTARDVERFCREWRLPVEGPWLRDWAEGEVPRLASRVAPPVVEEGLTGSILNEIVGGAEAALKELPVPQEDETSELTAPGPWELESGTSASPAREQLTASAQLQSPAPDLTRAPTAQVMVSPACPPPAPPPAAPPPAAPPPAAAAPAPTPTPQAPPPQAPAASGLAMPSRAREALRPPPMRGGVLPAIEDEDLPTQFITAIRTTPRPAGVRTTVTIPSARGPAEPVSPPPAASAIEAPEPAAAPPVAAPTAIHEAPAPAAIQQPPAVEEHTLESTTAAHADHALADQESTLADLLDPPEPHSVTVPRPSALELPTVEMSPVRAPQLIEAIAPVQAAPVQAAPVQAAPVQAAPVQAAPVQAAPESTPALAPPMAVTPLIDPNPTLEPPHEDDSIEISGTIAGIQRAPEEEITLAPSKQVVEALAARSEPAPAATPPRAGASTTPEPAPPVRMPPTPRPTSPRSQPPPERAPAPPPAVRTGDTLPDIRPERPIWPIVVGVVLLLAVGALVMLRDRGVPEQTEPQGGPETTTAPAATTPAAPAPTAPAPTAPVEAAPVEPTAPAPAATEPAPAPTPPAAAAPASATRSPTTSAERAAPRQTEPARSTSTASAPATTRPAPVPEPEPEPEPTPEPTPSADGPASVRVAGDASSVALVGNDGTRYSPPCSVPPGTYNLKATFSDGQERPAGKVTLGAGEDVTLKCNSAFRQCRK